MWKHSESPFELFAFVVVENDLMMPLSLFTLCFFGDVTLSESAPFRFISGCECVSRVEIFLLIQKFFKNMAVAR